jgi:hypothetical protein
MALLGLKLSNPVASLDDRQRLDEQRGATGRLIVNDALDAPSLVGLDRST